MLQMLVNHAVWFRGAGAIVLLVAALVLGWKARVAAGSVIPRSGRIDRWLRGFRFAAVAAGCVAVASGLLSGQVWLIGVGLAFALEETMETSVCLSALS